MSGSRREINHYPTVIFYIPLIDIYGEKPCKARQARLSSYAFDIHTDRIAESGNAAEHSSKPINPISCASTISRRSSDGDADADDDEGSAWASRKRETRLASSQFPLNKYHTAIRYRISYGRTLRK